MKRFLSLLLAFTVCFALLVTTSLADYPEAYTKDPNDYNQMLECVNKGSYGIELTQEYFAINPTEYNKGNHYKFKFESDGAEVQVAVFLMPGEILTMYGESTTLLTTTPITFSSGNSQELDCSGKSGAVQNGAYFGFNILTTSLNTDTKITVSVFCKNSGAGVAYDQVDEITYELKAAEQVSEDSLGMSVECDDRSGTEDGKQVYAGDTVSVSFTGADKFSGTSAVFSFDDIFELSGSVPDGWTEQDTGGYVYEISGTPPDDLGKFVLTVKASSGESSTGTLILRNNFDSSEPVEITETLYVIGKPIQYTITGLGSGNTVTTVYDGQPHHIEVVVTEPANAVIQYSETSLEDIVDGKPIDWQDTPPEWVDASINQPRGYTTRIKITADGYETVEISVNLSITSALLAVTPEDVTLYVGDPLPETFKYTVTGLVGEDKLIKEPTITCKAADTSKPGTYTLFATGADAGDNYMIYKFTGTLTIKDAWTVKLDDTVYKIEKGQPFTFPTEAPTKPGYIFMGWRGVDGVTYQPGDEVAITGDTSFKAIWANMPDITPGTPDEPDVDVFPFYDVSAGAWYYDAVKYVWEHELMNGVSATQFSPNTTLNRAMIWTMLARLDGVNTDGGANWYAKAQAWAMAEGVSDGTDPMGAVTREQLVTMLWRFKGEPTVDFLLTAKDADTVSSWAYEAMRWAVAEHIIEGDENGLITPTATATRAQAAAIFMRFIEL